MSFILDAIARSEQERQQQQAPDARSLAFPAAAPARPRSTAPLVLTAVLLLAGATLAALWIQSPRSLAPFVGPGGAAMPAAPDAAEQPRAPVESGDAPPAVPSQTPQPGATTPMLADSAAGKSVVRAQPSAVQKPAAAPTADPASQASVTDSQGENASAAAIASKAATAAADSRQASLDAAPAAPAAAAQTTASTSEAPRRQVTRLSDLPADVRRVLPSVVFTGHLYSKNPRASYVFIDGGRQVVAGQRITGDLLLDEITPTGVIVEFQGYLIEVGVLQNWKLK